MPVWEIAETRMQIARGRTRMKEAYFVLDPKRAKPAAPGWAVVILSSRESIEVLSRTIHTTAGVSGPDTLIDVVVNGNHALAQQASRYVEDIGATTACGPRLRVWNVVVGDKAHAWNQYVYGIWPGAERTFFVDGYVQVHPRAMNRLSEALDVDDHALAATGIPSSGRSAASLARQMEAERGIHGNLYLLRGQVLSSLRKQGFTLPLGIYRTDPLLGAAVKFNLDPTQYDWDPKRIRVVRDASWDRRPLSALSVGDWVTQFRRIRRQGCGVFESCAARRHLHVEHRPLGDLPGTASELIDLWMRGHPREVWRVLVKRPTASFALWSVRRSGDWSNVHVPPELMAETPLPSERPVPG